MTTPELPHEKAAGIENIKFCTLHDAGQGRLILTIPKEKFGDQAWRVRDLIQKELFPALHEGSGPLWGNDLGTRYQVELNDREKALQLVDSIEQWIQANVKP
ncbi:MAG: hypothetical protein A3J06_01285 [Candidatus Moranbacteria bacterium RIFCSPLOWO2_02_FULL_48_19]|nr:MAG: hypothetical protein A3J06_01285 [Candidatus Moranbacteria bacterium RIFCSPLOWO2_02_FULL_48_19]OGI31996.1 MAG: hypothetical protein A3G09_02935 [Candidatus Moranbacteria bacterium RIFCSPLOWO2_12_FULL_48_12]